MSLSEPTPEEVRARISEVSPRSRRLALTAQYLWAARRCEVTGKYHFVAENLELVTWRQHPVAIFKVVRGKVEVKEEGDEELATEPVFVVIPMNPDYEPLTKELVEFVQDRGQGKVFRFSDSTLWRASKSAFKGMNYKIMKGRRIKGWREAGTHFLKHIRISELINRFGFDGVDLVAYTGWSPKQTGMPPIMQRYAGLQWQKYVGKLCVPRVVA